MTKETYEKLYDLDLSLCQLHAKVKNISKELKIVVQFTFFKSMFVWPTVGEVIRFFCHQINFGGAYGTESKPFTHHNKKIIDVYSWMNAYLTKLDKFK